jgi:hypothetical protein
LWHHPFLPVIFFLLNELWFRPLRLKSCLHNFKRLLIALIRSPERVDQAAVSGFLSFSGGGCSSFFCCVGFWPLSPRRASPHFCFATMTGSCQSKHIIFLQKLFFCRINPKLLIKRRLS